MMTAVERQRAMQALTDLNVIKAAVAAAQHPANEKLVSQVRKILLSKI